MQRGELQACIIPVAAIEQHLEHLAMEHDWRSVMSIAVRIAEQLRPQVLVAEGLMCGVSEHHMKHPGTLTLMPGTFLAVLHDLIDSMVRAGFQNVIVLNGHGGNVVPCRSAWDQYLRRFQINLHFVSYWDIYTTDDAKLLQSGQRLPQDLPGHAQEFETSFALAEFPENVRTSLWSDQPDPAPAMATEEKGRLFIQRAVERLVALVRDIIDGRKVAEVPPFHP
jgi:creatinine amidohydrolase